MEMSVWLIPAYERLDMLFNRFVKQKRSEGVRRPSDGLGFHRRVSLNGEFVSLHQYGHRLQPSCLIYFILSIIIGRVIAGEATITVRLKLTYAGEGNRLK